MIAPPMLTLLRSVAAVAAGYLVFALSAFALFQLTGQAPHGAAPASFMAVSILSGVVFAFVGGWLAAVIAGRRPVAHGIAVAIVLALGAAVSLAMTIGHGAIWSQLAALLLMAPSAALGGWARARRTERA